MGRTGLFDLERHFAFYGAYHSNPVNILIHTLFVWPIFFTSLVLFHFTPSLYSFPNGFCLNFGLALTAMYATMLGFMCAWIRKLGLLLLCFVFSAGFNPPCLLAVLGFLCHGRVLEEAMTLNGRATWMNSAFLSIKRCTSLVRVLASDGLLVLLYRSLR